MEVRPRKETHCPTRHCRSKYLHRYEDRTALDDVSFDVRPAELFGLLGPNGSGKTTLFRILSTLMVPSAGRAPIMRISTPPKIRRRCAARSGWSSKPRASTKVDAVRKSLAPGTSLRLHGSSLKARINEILDRVGLADRAKELVETFSGGMARRVELAKGLLHHPSVLLLDEPTTGLDPGARRDLWQYLQILRDQERVSVIVTTHLMEEAERCDRLAILNEGKLVALGTPEELKHEIGADVILLDTTSDPESLAERVSTHFSVQATVMAKQVRIELENGHRFIAGVVEAFPGEIQAVTVSKPTLEDVFIHRTGHRFWSETGEEAKP